MSNVLKLSVIAYMPVRGQVYVGYCVIEIGMTWYWRQHSPISLRNGKYVSRISPCMLSTTFTSIFMASSKSTQCSMLLTTAATSDSSHPSSISCRAHCFMSRLFTTGVTSGHHRFKRKFSQNTFSFLHLSSLTHRIIQVLAIQLPIIRLSIQSQPTVILARVESQMSRLQPVVLGEGPGVATGLCWFMVAVLVWTV